MPTATLQSKAPTLDELRVLALRGPAELPVNSDEAGTFVDFAFGVEHLQRGNPRPSPGEATPIVFLQALGEIGEEAMAHYAQRFLAGFSRPEEEEAGRIYLRAFGYFLAANSNYGGEPMRPAAYLERIFSWALRDPSALVDDLGRPNFLAHRIADELKAIHAQFAHSRPEPGSLTEQALVRVTAPWNEALAAEPRLAKVSIR